MGTVWVVGGRGEVSGMVGVVWVGVFFLSTLCQYQVTILLASGGILKNNT